MVAAESRLGFVFRFQGLVDLISIAPFYLAGVDTRAVRALRLLRLLRVLKLQTHILENTVAARTRELADKNASLEQAQALLKSELDVWLSCSDTNNGSAIHTLTITNPDGCGSY